MIKHNHNFPLEEPATAPATGTNDFTPTQKNYLQGLAMGTDVARKIRGLPVITGAGAVECPANSRPEVPPIPIDSPDCWMAAAQQQQVSAGGTLCAEEIAKRDIHVSALWDAMMLRAAEGQFPKGTDVFLQKHFGMFYVAPAQNSYMCRLRFAGGALTAHQMHGLADIADHFAGGFTDVTTRANLQLREIAADNSMDVLLALRDLGILNSGAGADNIRNITASPLSGIDPKEAIETLPLARQLHHHILQHRELYGLPRKFNIAFDGGGSISSLDDTNDIGFHAVRLPAEYATSDCPEGVYFQLGLGGITGHLDFARDTGILVRPDQCVMVATAIVKVFIAHGNRTDRKKARLKYLLDAWGFTKFLEMVAAELTFPLARIPADQVVTYDNENRLAHIGWHSQRQPGMSYVGVVLPVGRLTAVQMRGISRIATQFGDGQLRLTVWQNLVIPNIRSTDQSAVEMELEALGLDWRASNVRRTGSLHWKRRLQVCRSRHQGPCNAAGIVCRRTYRT